MSTEKLFYGRQLLHEIQEFEGVLHIDIAPGSMYYFQWRLATIEASGDLPVLLLSFVPSS